MASEALRKKYPNLSKAWDDYGHSIPWSELFEIKFYGHYAALSWKEPNGEVNYADMARGGSDEPWEMQNDGHDPMPLSVWRRGKRVPQCDWMEFPEEKKS